MFKSNQNYANRTKLLKKAGILGPEYSLNTKLTTGQKSNITKKYKEFKQYFENPQSFAVKSISRENSQAFKESGYKTVKTKKKAKIFIPISEGAQVKIKGKIATIDEPTRTYKIHASKSKDLVKDLEKFGDKKLPKNNYLTVTVGGNRPIHRQFNSKTDMLKYVQAKSTGRQYKGKKIDQWHNDDAIRHITIITIVDAGKEKRKEIKKQNVANRQSKKKK